MRYKNERNIPIGMQKVYRRLERWRRKLRGRSAIPERLWAAAEAVRASTGLGDGHWHILSFRNNTEASQRPRYRLLVDR